MRALTASDYVALPWQWVGPVRQGDASGGTSYEIRVRELPDFLVAGASPEAVLADVAEALEAFIASYLDRGETPPLPESIRRADGRTAVIPFVPALAPS